MDRLLTVQLLLVETISLAMLADTEVSSTTWCLGVSAALMIPIDAQRYMDWLLTVQLLRIETILVRDFHTHKPAR